ncbi:MAG: hypothetical protein ACJ768_11625 [Gaiellaceae bacterium]
MTATDGNEMQPLNAKQMLAVDLLASGCSDREAAAELDVDRATIWRWRNHNADFQTALNGRRKEVWEGLQDRFRNLIPRAFDTIEQAIAGGDSRAALALLKLSGLGAAELGRIGPVDGRAIAESERQASARPKPWARATDEFLRRFDEDLRAAERGELDAGRALAGATGPPLMD